MGSIYNIVFALGLQPDDLGSGHAANCSPRQVWVTSVTTRSSRNRLLMMRMQWLTLPGSVQIRKAVFAGLHVQGSRSSSHVTTRRKRPTKLCILKSLPERNGLLEHMGHYERAFPTSIRGLTLKRGRFMPQEGGVGRITAVGGNPSSF